MLKLKGISGEYAYATVMTIEPTTSATYTFNFVSCQDADGNNYSVVEIGEQTWMAENIKTTSSVGGGNIPLVTDDTEWSNLGNSDKAYCFYDNNNANAETYGALYTYAAATNGDNSGTGVQGVCPTGWHLPSDAEWTVLTDELGGESVAGGKLKSTCMELWNSPNTGATNENGFTGLPGGIRHYDYGIFGNLGIDGDWWSATEEDATNSWYWELNNDNSYMGGDNYNKICGFSVRCLQY